MADVSGPHAAGLAELDKILAKLEEIKKSTADMVTNITGSNTGGEASIPDGSDQREPILGGEGPQTTGPYIDLRGATIFGYDEFARPVAEAQAQNTRRAGLVPA